MTANALVLATLLAVASPEAVPEPSELWVQAGTAFKQGDFTAAVALYSRLAQAGFDSGQVHYNLGNAYLRAGQLGAAISAYRKAALELPRDEDVAANLAFARQKVQDAVAWPMPSPMLRTLFFWHYSLSARELIVALALANLGLWSALALRLWRRDLEALRLIAIGLGALVAALSLSFGVHSIADERVAVVLQPEVQVRAGIGQDAVVRFVLHEGTEATALDSEDGWIRIALADGKQGWLPSESVSVIEQ